MIARHKKRAGYLSASRSHSYLMTRWGVGTIRGTFQLPESLPPLSHEPLSDPPESQEPESEPPESQDPESLPPLSQDPESEPESQEPESEPEESSLDQS